MAATQDYSPSSTSLEQPSRGALTVPLIVLAVVTVVLVMAWAGLGGAASGEHPPLVHPVRLVRVKLRRLNLRLALPGSRERALTGFAGHSKATGSFKVHPEERDALLATAPTVCEVGWTTNSTAWVKVRLEDADPEEVFELSRMPGE